MRTTLFIFAWTAAIAGALVGVTFLDKHESEAHACEKSSLKN